MYERQMQKTILEQLDKILKKDNIFVLYIQQLETQLDLAPHILIKKDTDPYQELPEVKVAIGVLVKDSEDSTTESSLRQTESLEELVLGDHT